MQKAPRSKNAWISWEWERKKKHRSGSITGSPAGEIRRKEVVSIDEVVNSWKTSLAQKNMLKLAEISTRWEGIVGKEIAIQSQPVQIERGKLIIRVKDSLWRTQLFYMKRELLRKIRSSLGEKAVKDLIFTG